jgi:hypothetical protein
VIHPYMDGRELLRLNHPERYVIDFPSDELTVSQALAPEVFGRIEKLVLPDREQRAREEAEANEQATAHNAKARVNWHHRGFLNTWWQHSYRRGELMAAVQELDRYLAISRVAAKDRMPVFVFVDSSIHLSDAAQCLAVDDDYSFGIVQSQIHEAWLRARCSKLKSDLRYTTKTIWHSFPWPQEPGAAQVESVVRASKTVLDLRAEYLGEGISLVNQYDSLRLPGKSRLRVAHQELDDAVRAAYGFGAGDPLRQVLDLNLELAQAEAVGEVRSPGPARLAGVNLRATDYRMVPDPGYLAACR